MHRISYFIRAGVFIAACGVLAGCSTVEKALPGGKADYKTSQSAQPLDVPPDLSSSGVGDTMQVPSSGTAPSGSATYSQYVRDDQAPGQARTGGSKVLPEFSDVQLKREGDRQWLVVHASPQQVWNKVRDFWLQNGFVLKKEDPAAGIMQTGWVENRADIPQGPIRNFLSKTLGSLYSAATRDRYRVRLERGARPGTTEVYLTQQGMEEVVTQGNVGSSDAIWKPRPPDPGLEAEMTKRLMVFLGVDKARAQQMVASPRKQPAKAVLGKDSQGRTQLTIREGFSRAWRSAGTVLDRVGFTVQDRDRSKGVYYVRYDDPEKAQGDKSWLSKLAFWKKSPPPSSDQYQVKLTGETATSTRVTILDADGKRDNSETAQRILKLLHEQLQ